MVKQYFYLYPLGKILQLFPRLNPQECMSYLECGIGNGWVPPMEDYLNKICPVVTIQESGTCKIVHIDNSIFAYDIRMGDILEVDTRRKKDCWFLEYDGKQYHIKDRRTTRTIGGIINRPPPPKPKRINRLAILMAGRKEN